MVEVMHNTDSSKNEEGHVLGPPIGVVGGREEEFFVLQYYG
jgi:hypothetical protein